MLLDRISMPKERTLFRPHGHMDDCHTYRGVLRMVTLAGNKSLLFVTSIVRATGTSVKLFSKFDKHRTAPTEGATMDLESPKQGGASPTHTMLF